MAATDLSPNVDNYYIGGGIVWFFPEGGAKPGDWRDVGNVPEFEFENAIERRPHFSRRGAIRQIDFNPVASQTATVRINPEEFTGPNLVLAFLGAQTGADATASIDIGAVPQIKGELLLQNLTDLGPRWNIWLPSVSISPNGAIAMLGDDYGNLPLTGEVEVVAGRFGVISRADITEANTTFWPAV